MTARPVDGLVARDEWLMTPGERAALEGVLAVVRPSLAVEIGTWSGGSLERIAAYSETVHAFDLRRHQTVTAERFPNVELHVGDSHELLPPVLARLRDEGRNVDFALVDGDHSVEGARRDLEDLLSSPCTGETVILLHDTLNERVRTGLERVDLAGSEKIRFADLDFVQGRVLREGPQADELWYGLGLVVTGPALADDERWPDSYAAPDVYGAFSRALREEGRVEHAIGHRQLLDLEEQLAEQRRVVAVMERSLSWRVTAPLRRARNLARRR